MKEQGLDDTLLLEIPFVEAAVKEISQFLRQSNRPTALVCSNDLIAIRAIRAAHKVGLRVPEDISITGFDGIALGEDLSPTLSTVTQPNAEIGKLAVDLLINALSTGVPVHPSASLLLASGFREGESCSPAVR